LRLADERCKHETQSDNDREPDPPHGHLDRGWLAGSLSDPNHSRVVSPSVRLMSAPYVHVI